MSEEMIKQIKRLLFDYTEVYDDEPIIQGLQSLIKDNYISKDKIRDILLKFQNKYSPYLETTDRLFIGKEVVEYGDDILDEIAAELDIKLLEE